MNAIALPFGETRRQWRKRDTEVFLGGIWNHEIHEGTRKRFCGLSLCVSASLWEIKSNTPIRVHLIFVTFRVFRGF